MKLSQLEKTITLPLFTSHQVERLFVQEPKEHIHTQLSRFVKRHQLIRLKRNLYQFPSRPVDEFVIANGLYQPSYLSLESALNTFGIIPDVPSEVTSVTPTTSKMFTVQQMVFTYSRLQGKLYFGFEKVKDAQSELYYEIAEVEKALLDWLYLRNIKNLTEYRVDLRSLDKAKLKHYSQPYPHWIQQQLYV